MARETEPMFPGLCGAQRMIVAAVMTVHNIARVGSICIYGHFRRQYFHFHCEHVILGPINLHVLSGLTHAESVERLDVCLE